MTDAAILLDIRDGLARITLNRPEKLNAFDREMAETWADVATAPRPARASRTSLAKRAAQPDSRPA